VRGKDETFWGKEKSAKRNEDWVTALGGGAVQHSDHTADDRRKKAWDEEGVGFKAGRNWELSGSVLSEISAVPGV